MRDKILKVHGGTLQMQVAVDPELIAGFVMTMNDQRIDASMSGRLNRLRLGLQKPGA
jgi:F0F1-type ATP synthase delta subunit